MKLLSTPGAPLETRLSVGCGGTAAPALPTPPDRRHRPSRATMKSTGRFRIMTVLPFLLFSAGAGAADKAVPERAASFKWMSSAPLIAPGADQAGLYGLKDPSIVRVDGRYHVFMTTAGEKGWGVAYTSFKNWADAGTSPVFPLERSAMGPGYRAAPQVYYFAPQQLWYLVYQGGDPLYSTTRTLGDPSSWSVPKPFFNTAPAIVRQRTGHAEWLDFWNICDEKKCYLFFTDDQGKFFRSETAIADFPHGFSDPVLVMKADKRDDMFEASNTYKVAGADAYITLIEAMGPKGRYFRAWKSRALDGEWTPLTGDKMNVFASADNVTYRGQAWSEGVSHGELIRSSNDQTLTIDPCKPLEFLYQGLLAGSNEKDYLKLPYRLAVITADGPNPISAMCVR
ncbi:non-reducing end alpha-L-arabinofuranosidase family hydrolase [Massilia sp. METH4]|uniref:non-reducing end alpha-L-arabinofuranosidase family hydrolase n=1 Tax=Massilia sp. METH4 TaxID=3123041 RepID=UPI0030D15BE4